MASGSPACVRLVVPISTSLTWARRMTSGTRKAPPISTSSPRETTASLPWARRVERQQHGGGVVVDDGGGDVRRRPPPVRPAGRKPGRRGRRARRMGEVVFQRAGARAAATMASMAASASCARPRLVCSTVPVRLKTGRSLAPPHRHGD